jgi:hypothetical protein
MDRDTTMCFICGKTILLEIAKTNECGRAVHEECYVLRMKLEKATTAGLMFPDTAVAAPRAFARQRRTG